MPPTSKSPPVEPRPTSSRMILDVTSSVTVLDALLTLVCKPELGGTTPLGVAQPALGFTVKTPPAVSVNTMD